MWHKVLSEMAGRSTGKSSHSSWEPLWKGSVVSRASKSEEDGSSETRRDSQVKEACSIASSSPEDGGFGWGIGSSSTRERSESLSLKKERSSALTWEGANWVLNGSRRHITIDDQIRSRDGGN